MSDPGVCWNCGAPRPTGTQFCGQCGRPERSCLSCGARISANEVVCPACHGEHQACRSCAALMSMDADFCPACGRETLERLRVEEQRIRAGWRERHRAAKAIAVVFVGVLLSLVLAGSAGVVWENAAFLLVGLLAVALLGRSAFRQSLAKATTVRMLVLGMLAGVPSFAISYLYVNALHGSGQGGGADPITIHTVLTLCIMPALMEEWLCRGVLWVASRRIASARNTILITSILFAMMHGLGGGWTLEFPHRFVAGLIFGWLRLRSGSLLPGMLAHYLHNSLALILSSH